MTNLKALWKEFGRPNLCELLQLGHKLGNETSVAGGLYATVFCCVAIPAIEAIPGLESPTSTALTVIAVAIGYLSGLGVVALAGWRQLTEAAKHGGTPAANVIVARLRQANDTVQTPEHP